MIKHVVLGHLLFATLPLHGESYSMKSSEVLKMSISNRGLTRLSVHKDPIQDILVYPFDLDDHIQLHESGNVFIVGDGLSKPFSLTLITRSGGAQDLNLQTSSKDPTPIVLESEAPKITQELIQAWLSDFRKGFVPNGFKSISVDKKCRGREHLKAVPVRAWRKEDALITQYTVQSTLEEAVICNSESYVSSEE
ncbi:MAG: hypothetical protein F9K49_07410, partial [Caedimonadaceae bacterium]